ncbi:hypothetical protein [Saccharobesus litoralis]|nr:hypothetical protein [Saccharobesus litoralis]
MNRTLTTTLLTILISGCASNKMSHEELWHSHDLARVERAKTLYSCGMFFAIAGDQRQNEIEKSRYHKYSAKATNLAKELTPIDGSITDDQRKKLKKRYNLYAFRTSQSWIKAIGNDPEGNVFKNITKDCVSAIQNEDFIDTIDKLHNKISPKP